VVVVGLWGCVGGWWGCGVGVCVWVFGVCGGCFVLFFVCWGGRCKGLCCGVGAGLSSSSCAVVLRLFGCFFGGVGEGVGGWGCWGCLRRLEG